MRLFNPNDTVLMKYFSIYASAKTEKMRFYVAYILGLTDSLTEQIKSLLLQLIRDKSINVQYQAAKSLSNFEDQLSNSANWLVHFILMQNNFQNYLKGDIDYHRLRH